MVTHKKLSIVIVLMMVCCIIFSGCGQVTIDGEWVLTKKVLADGTVCNKSDIEEAGMSEVYIISGEEVHYTCIAPPLGTRNIDMTMVSIGENEYTFYIADRLVFAVATLEGKQLSYVLGEAGDTTTFIFEKR